MEAVPWPASMMLNWITLKSVRFNLHGLRVLCQDHTVASNNASWSTSLPHGDERFCLTPGKSRGCTSEPWPGNGGLCDLPGAGSHCGLGTMSSGKVQCLLSCPAPCCASETRGGVVEQTLGCLARRAQQFSLQVMAYVLRLWGLAWHWLWLWQAWCWVWNLRPELNFLFLLSGRYLHTALLRARGEVIWITHQWMNPLMSIVPVKWHKYSEYSFPCCLLQCVFFYLNTKTRHCGLLPGFLSSFQGSLAGD